MTPDGMRAALTLHGYRAIRGMQWCAVGNITYQVNMELGMIGHCEFSTLGTVWRMQDILGVEMGCLSDDEIQGFYEYIEATGLWT